MGNPIIFRHTAPAYRKFLPFPEEHTTCLSVNLASGCGSTHGAPMKGEKTNIARVSLSQKSMIDLLPHCHSLPVTANRFLDQN